MADNRQKPPQNNRPNRGQQSEPTVWKDESDSPIEQAKMHPFIKKVLMSSNIILMIGGAGTMAYMHTEIWNWDDDFWDMLYLLTIFGPPVLHLILLKIQRTAKVREDE